MHTDAMDELQMIVIALGYVVAFVAGRWTAMRSALMNTLSEAVSDGIDKFEDVTGIDVPDDLEEKIENAVDDLAEDIVEELEETASEVVEAVENAESVDEIVESVKDIVDVAMDDLEDLTVVGLKERLTDLGLSTKGRKADLIARIKEYVEESQ